MPPCNILNDCAEVPAPKSKRSTSATLSPRIAASQAAQAAPIPPPMTRTSKLRLPSASRVVARVVLPDDGVVIIDAFRGKFWRPRVRRRLFSRSNASVLGDSEQRSAGILNYWRRRHAYATQVKRFHDQEKIVGTGDRTPINLACKRLRHIVPRRRRSIRQVRVAKVRLRISAIAAEHIWNKRLAIYYGKGRRMHERFELCGSGVHRQNFRSLRDCCDDGSIARHPSVIISQMCSQID